MFCLQKGELLYAQEKIFREKVGIEKTLSVV